MPITFYCGCGQSMTVRDEFAGKMGRCPRCKNPVSVPLASTAAPGAPPQFAPPPAPPGMPPMPLPTPGPATPRPMPRPVGPAPAGMPPGMGMPPGPQRPGGPSTVLGAPAIAPPRPGAAPAAQPRPQPAPPGQSGPTARPGAPRPPAKKGAKLLVVNGPQGYAGKVYPVQTAKPTVIGRDPQADVPIPSERISRRHCQLEPAEDGLYVVADLGSSNGTLVNQERVNGRKVLLGGEYIQVGDVLLRFADS